METFGKNGRFSGRIWPDWGNAVWADMAGLGSLGFRRFLETGDNCYHFMEFTV